MTTIGSASCSEFEKSSYNKQFSEENKKRNSDTGKNARRINSLVNLRDVGGYITRDGRRVRTGLMYRSNEFTNISDDDMDKLTALQLKYIYDLRDQAEKPDKPCQIPPGTRYVALDLLKDSQVIFSPAFFQMLIANLQTADKIIDGASLAGIIKDYYCEYVSLPSARAAFHRLFLDMAEPDKLPSLYHCGSGKDRTGWTSVALLTLLGVPEETVMQDYMLSNDHILTQKKAKYDYLKENDAVMAIVLAIFGVWPEYLNAALNEMHNCYGTIENYFSEGLGIDQTVQQSLRDIFLE